MRKRSLAVAVIGTAMSFSAPVAVEAAGTAPPGKQCSKTDISGCYTYSETEKVAGYSYAFTKQVANKLYPRMAGPKAALYIPQGRIVNGLCGTFNDEAFAYCPADRSIFMGQKWLWKFYDEAGDAAPIFALSHEWGHHIQTMRKVPQPTKPLQSITFENQADCIAGGFMRQLASDGSFLKDDLDDIDNIMPIVASEIDTTGSRSHGTLAERIEAAYLGINKGLPACDDFFPNRPVSP